MSRGAVSDIVNRGRSANYTEETQQLVLKTMREMGYRPTRSAQNLSRGHSDTIGVLFPSDLENIFLARLFHFIAEALWEVSLSPELMLMLPGGDGDIVKALDQLVDRGVDGVIIGPLYAEDQVILDRLQSVGPPRLPSVVFGGLGTSLPGYRDISLDDNIAGGLAIEHLIGRGHRRISFLGTLPTSQNADAGSLQAGAEAALKKNGLHRPDWFEPIERHGEHESCLEGALAFAKKWQITPEDDRPTAVLCKSDQIAMAALAVLHKRGIRVPADLSVLGYDNIPECLITIPALSSIDNDQRRRTAQLVAAIIQQIGLADQATPYTSANELAPPAPSVVERASVAGISEK